MSNCKKCGKEIDEGELCEECKSKNSTSATKIIGIVVIIVLVAVVGFGFFAANAPFMKNTPIGNIFKFMKIVSNSVGNTPANLQNYGYSVEGDKYIFYLLPDENAKFMKIYRMDKNGKNEKVIYEREWNVASLNAVKNDLYFIGYETTEDSLTAKIYKMDIDGKNVTEITDDISQSSGNICVIDNEIYYINQEFKTCKVSINGGESQLVSDDSNGFVSIVDGWIYYVDYNTENYAMCKKKMDGTEAAPIIGDVMYDLNVVGDDLYYVNKDGKFCKKHKDDEEKVISETEIYNVNISNNRIYYMRYINPENKEEYKVGLYSMNLDGSDEKQIKEFKSYSSFLNVVGDWIMYSDQDQEKGYMGMIKTDGSEEKNMYEINFAEMDKNAENTNTENTNPETNVEPQETTPAENSNNQEENNNVENTETEDSEPVEE